ncbi:hypothetical protein AVEN_82240-1 [Araneus ventricosus]|uniref:Uncharacterized protein n=1 Tax=Araneus ventricosus TaxID=182803 RepID=A0A4Y2HYF9_ARAVE|nr:hypothetical protein AVEN_82240-1 [Araneus ventricosus]
MVIKALIDTFSKSTQHYAVMVQILPGLVLALVFLAKSMAHDKGKVWHLLFGETTLKRHSTSNDLRTSLAKRMKQHLILLAKTTLIPQMALDIEICLNPYI